jgi:hypothetical protein
MLDLLMSIIKILFSIIKKPLPAIIFIFSVLLLIWSFIDISYDEKWTIMFIKYPNIFIFVVSILMLCCFFIWFLSKDRTNNGINNKERKQYNYSIEINGEYKIIIKQDDVSNYIGDENKALLLPINTSFDEKCITDKDSALGSYFKNKNIEKAKKLIVGIASKQFSFSVNKKSSNIGDIILLPMYEGNNNILIAAATQDLPGIGIQADALSIITTVKKALSFCSEKRYSSITMPIIGTGHGGISHSISLALICLQYFISINYSQNHHAKELIIIVFDPDRRLERNILATVECIKKLISLNSNGGKK